MNAFAIASNPKAAPLIANTGVSWKQMNKALKTSLLIDQPTLRLVGPYGYSYR